MGTQRTLCDLKEGKRRNWRKVGIRDYAERGINTYPEHTPCTPPSVFLSRQLFQRDTGSDIERPA